MHYVITSAQQNFLESKPLARDVMIAPSFFDSVQMSICGFTINIVLCFCVHQAITRSHSEKLCFSNAFYHAHVDHNTLLVCDIKPQRLFTREAVMRRHRSKIRAHGITIA